MRRALRPVAAVGILTAVTAATLSAAAAAADASPAPAATSAVTVGIPGVLGYETTAPGAATGTTTGGTRTGTSSTGTTDAGAGPTAPAAPQPGTQVSTKYRLVIQPWRIHPGERFTAEGGGFTPGEKVTFVLFPGGRSVGESAAETSGRVLVSATFPRSGAAGLYSVQATGIQSGRVAAADLAVVGDSIPGTSWWGIVIVAIGVLLAVSALLLALKLGMLGGAALNGVPR